EALLARAAACGYTALAMTDTNNLYGAVAFAEQAHHHGVRPILGACLRQQRSRCVALIAERAGYRSLCRILSRLHLESAARLADQAAQSATAAEYPTYRPVTAARRNTLLAQLPDRLPTTPDHHLGDPATLRRRFRDLPEAARNTDLLAEQLRSDVLPRDVILP